MIKISERLMSLSKYVFEEDKVMDVGCDHAKLDIYLVQAGIINHIYVCDVNPNALNNGKENIEKYELSKNITPVLSYGIEKIGEFDIDTLIISGMGSKNIIDIISSPNLNQIYKLILQSNNNHNELRMFLLERGFKIAHEEIVKDGKKTYINIIAVRDYDRTKYTEKEFEFGPVLITDPVNIDYFRELKDTYYKLYEKNNSEDTKKKIYYLDEIIRDLQDRENL